MSPGEMIPEGGGRRGEAPYRLEYLEAAQQSLGLVQTMQPWQRVREQRVRGLQQYAPAKSLINLSILCTTKQRVDVRNAGTPRVLLCSPDTFGRMTDHK